MKKQISILITTLCLLLGYALTLNAIDEKDTAEKDYFRIVAYAKIKPRPELSDSENKVIETISKKAKEALESIPQAEAIRLQSQINQARLIEAQMENAQILEKIKWKEMGAGRDVLDNIVALKKEVMENLNKR